MNTSFSQPFATAQAFASFMCTERWGRKHVAWLNTVSGQSRLEQIQIDCERYSRWTIEDGGIAFGYNAAAYGLWWSVRSGRVNSQTAQAVYRLNARQLCELVHTLLVECGPTLEDYPRFLMHRYSTRRS